MIVWILLAVGAVAALAYWPMATDSPGGLGRSVLKTVSVAVLALAALAVDADPWLCLGLAFGAVGDWALSRPGQRAFVAGLAAFLLGHLAYVLLFIGWPGSDQGNLSLGAAPVITGVLLLFCLLMGWRLWRVTGALRLPVLVYIAVIAAMGLASLTLPLGHDGQLAALLFIASDALLAAELFLIPQGHRLRRAAARLVWPLYWLAQALFLVTFGLLAQVP